MPVKKALLTVVLCSVAFGCIGTACGAAIGQFAPGYYRSIFRGGQSPQFNPLEVGLGLGLIQGIAAGAAIGLAVVALLLWRDVRSLATPTTSASANRSQPTQSLMILWGIGTVLLVVAVSTVTFVLGAILREGQFYHELTELKLAKIEKILETKEYPHVHSDFSSQAQVYLSGDVMDEATRQALRDKLVLAFGSAEADNMMRLVQVRQR